MKYRLDEIDSLSSARRLLAALLEENDRLTYALERADDAMRLCLDTARASDPCASPSGYYWGTPWDPESTEQEYWGAR